MPRRELKIARIRAGYTQEELAKVVGVSQQTIAKWERAKTTPSHFGTIRVLERELSTNALYLFPDLFK